MALVCIKPVSLKPSESASGFSECQMKINNAKAINLREKNKNKKNINSNPLW